MEEFVEEEEWNNQEPINQDNVSKEDYWKNYYEENPEELDALSNETPPQEN